MLNSIPKSEGSGTRRGEESKMAEVWVDSDRMAFPLSKYGWNRPFLNLAKQNLMLFQ